VPGYYDLHAHILPGVDDGPKDMVDSIEMARVAAKDGTAVLLATPHNKDVNQDHSVAYVRDLIKEFARQLQSNNVQLQLLLGMENHIEPDLPEQVKEGRALTVNSSRYILVELPFTSYPRFASDVIFKLQLQGLTPIIVHPERNTVIQRYPSTLESLVEKGILAQVTAGSLLGVFGPEPKKSSEVLLKRNLLHFIASDTHHHLGPRNPTLTMGMEAAAKVVGHERARAMVIDTPRAVVNNQPVEIEPLLKEPRRFLWPFR